jgi:hypothetical protein
MRSAKKKKKKKAKNVDFHSFSVIFSVQKHRTTPIFTLKIHKKNIKITPTTVISHQNTKKIPKVLILQKKLKMKH